MEANYSHCWVGLFLVSVQLEHEIISFVSFKEMIKLPRPWAQNTKYLENLSNGYKSLEENHHTNAHSAQVFPELELLDQQKEEKS